MADIALKSNGLVIVIIHLLIRFNAGCLTSRPSAIPRGIKRSLQRFGSKDLNTRMAIRTSLSLDRSDSAARIAQAPSGEKAPLFDVSMTNSTNPRIQEANPIFPKAKQSIPATQFARPSNTPQWPLRTKSTYSIFPTVTSAQHLSMSTSNSSGDEEIICLPAPLFSRTHRRDDSNNTSETVQIGMRLSHAIADRGSSIISFQQQVSNCTVMPEQDALPSQLSTTETYLSAPSTPPRSSFTAFWAVQRDSVVQPVLPRKGLMKSLPPIPKPLYQQRSSALRLFPPNPH